MASINGDTERKIELVKSAPHDLQAKMEAHRRMIEQRDVTPDLAMHGQLIAVFFEQQLERGAAQEGAGRLLWNTGGPRVAFTHDHRELLVLDPIAPELPDVPEQKGGLTIQRPQRWEKLGPRIVEGRGGALLVYRAVRQIVFRAPTGFYGEVRCHVGSFDDFTSAVVPLDEFGAVKGELYFIGGRLEFAVH